MEELRTRFYNTIDLVEEKNPTVFNQLAMLELQAKLLALDIIARESILTILKLSKDELIEFILSLNMYYMHVIEQEETIAENSTNNMNVPYCSQYTEFGYSSDCDYQSQAPQMTWSYGDVSGTSGQYSDQDNFYGSYQYQYQNYENWQTYHQIDSGWNEAVQY